MKRAQDVSCSLWLCDVGAGVDLDELGVKAVDAQHYNRLGEESQPRFAVLTINLSHY